MTVRERETSLVCIERSPLEKPQSKKLLQGDNAMESTRPVYERGRGLSAYTHAHTCTTTHSHQKKCLAEEWTQAGLDWKDGRCRQFH